MEVRRRVVAKEHAQDNSFYSPDHWHKYIPVFINNCIKIRILFKILCLGRFFIKTYEHEINRSQHGRYENGEGLRFSSLLKVLKALDISLAEFFGEGFKEE